MFYDFGLANMDVGYMCNSYKFRSR